MRKIAALMAVILSAGFCTELVTYSDSWGAHPLFNKVNETPGGVEIVFSIHEMIVEDIVVDNEQMQVFGIPGIFLFTDEGAPNLAGTGQYIAIPQGAQAQVTILDARTEVMQNVDVAPSPQIPRETDTDPLHYVKDKDIYTQNAYFPSTPVQLSEPTKIRGVDIVVLGVTPFQYNPVTKELVIYTDLRIRIDFLGGNGHFGDDRLRSRFWDPLLQQQIINFSSLPDIDFYSSERMQSRDGFEYIIIVPDDAVFEAWADTIKQWRIEQGVTCDVFTLSEVGGSSSTAIEQFLNNAYNTWDPAPVAFLLLSDYNPSGDDYGITSPLWGNYCRSDNMYADVNNNQRPDMHHGRITAQNEEHLSSMIGKMLSYEREPYTDAGFYDHPLSAAGWQNDRWFQLCAEVIRGFWIHELGKDPARQYALGSPANPYPGCAWSTNPNTSIVVNYFHNLGYIPLTNPYDAAWWNNGNAAGINAAINAGAFYVQHRDHGFEQGWGEPDYSTGDLAGLTNDMYTFVNSSNCLTGKYDYPNEVFAERFHRMEHGCLGINAATEVSYSFVNDTYVWGMMDALWSQFMPDYPVADVPWYNEMRPAFAMSYGKHFLYQSSWPYNPSSKTVTYHLFHHHGDAFSILYSEIPQNLTVIHGTKLHDNQTSFSVTANDSAVIALTAGGEVIGVAEGTGSAVSVPVVQQTAGTAVKIVVTKANHYRYEADILVVPANYAWMTPGTTIIDDGGDGFINPGESIDLGVYGKNMGTQTASSVYGLLSESDPKISISVDSSWYGSISVDDSSLSSPYYTFTVANDCRDGHIIQFDHEYHDTYDSTWTGFPEFTVHAPELTHQSHNTTVGIGVLYPDQTSDFVVTIKNDGSATASSISSTLYTTSSYISINDASGSYGTLGPGATGTNNSDPFNLSADSMTPLGAPADFTLIVEAGVYVDTIDFTMTIGRSVPTDTGYYYAYHKGGDPNYSPVFSWVAIDSTQSTYPGVSLDLDRNETVVVDLPFTFTYYGIDYDRISICSNGWIAMDSTGETAYANGSIPGVTGPPAMIAGLWDYLNPGNTGEPSDIYYYYDATNHRFIVEYFQIEHYPSGGYYETFEIILHDPDYYTTPTGDGEIIVQYLDSLQFPISLTVGIENETETVGVAYYVNGTYDDLAVSITDEFAIKYTTYDPGEIWGIEDFPARTIPAYSSFTALFPNPFTRTMHVAYQLSSPGLVDLVIYDAAGRAVRTLVHEKHSAGYHTAIWNGTDAQGRSVPSGIYFIRFTTDDYDRIEKAVLLK